MLTIETAGTANQSALMALFAGSEACSTCWCMNHRRPPEACPAGDRARRALLDALQRGRAHGLLAMDAGEAVGWCAVDPLDRLLGHDLLRATPPIASAYPDAWLLHCLFVALDHRGQGVSGALVSAAIGLARSHGAATLLAAPIPADTLPRFPPHEAEFSGRSSTFSRRGFVSTRRVDDFHQLMVLPLGAEG